MPVLRRWVRFGTIIMRLSNKRWQRRLRTFLPWLVGLLFVVVEVRRVADQIAVRYPDFFGWAERAARFDLHHLANWQWVDGLYPLGYPLLLRLGVALGLDVLRTAFAISILGGFLGLMGTFWLVRRMTGNWTLALLSQITLGCLDFYLFYANLDATDALPAGMQICSFALLLAEEKQRRAAMWAGLLAGASYLLRYTASVTILLSFLYLLGSALAQRRRDGLLAAVYYLLAAGVGASPQLIPSLLLTGNPFYTHQAHNLWFHLLGSDDYIRAWHAVPMDISLWEVVSANPQRFFTHWWETFRSAWITGDAMSVDPPLGPLAHAGLLFAVLARGSLSKSARWFIALYTVGFLALMSFVRLDRRFLITLMPLQVLGCLYMLWHLLPGMITVRRLKLPVRLPLLLIVVALYLPKPLDFMVSNSRDEQIVEVSNTLHAAGMTSAGEVLSTQVEFHDVADVWKRRFDMAFAVAPNLGSYDQLLALLHQRGYRFFIIDRATGLFLYPQFEFLLHPENRPEGLTPIYVQQDRAFAIYRVERENSHLVEMDTPFENGVTLVGYEMTSSHDMPPGSGVRLGLYLHWEAATPVSQPLKVFVHVLDGAGQLVAQHDSVPALWTYPLERWTPGERVVDFHPIYLAPDLIEGPLTIHVGWYDPATGRRFAVLTPGTAPGDDHIALGTFSFD